MFTAGKNLIRFSLLTSILIAAGFALKAQNKDSWISFWNKDTTLFGFKDANGVIKIEPKFTAFSIARRFDDIIAVTEERNETQTSYYLTRAGRIVGRDSLHIFDNGADCESEGFIRFRDYKTDRAGMFNRNGDIVIPARYNDLTRVRNGMIIALKDAEKKQSGEHFFWRGGKAMLIDSSNNILIDNFEYNDNLNFFSLLLSSKPNTDTVRQNFKGINGQYYSFINFEKEFKAWLKSSLLNNFTKDNLLKASSKDISFWKEPGGWTSESKASFLKRNFEIIRTKLLALNSKSCDYSIFNESLNQYIYDSEDYKGFYDNCGEAKDWSYPVKNIVISYNKNKKLIQDQFEFLRTDDGYKLISVAISKGALQ